MGQYFYKVFLNIPFHIKDYGTVRNIFWNGVLILNEKDNKEACATCFEIRIPRKKNNKLLWKVPSKNFGNNFTMEKNKKVFRFANISEYHHREMGLMTIQDWYITSSYVTSEMNLIIVSSRTSLDFVDKHCIAGNLVMLFLLSYSLQYSAYFTSYQIYT